MFQNLNSNVRTVAQIGSDYITRVLMNAEDIQYT
jgi:hypothetical protein